MSLRFLSMIAVLAVVSTSSIRAQAPLPADRHEFDSDGVRIHYLDRGKGEPVILIHGFGANLDVNWGGMINRLSDDYRVIAIDNRGHGRSEKPHDPEYGVEMVNDVIRLMDHLGIERAHIVGYSMGSLITGKFLAEHPDRVISAVIGGMGWLELDDNWTKMLDEIAASLDAGKGPVPLLRYLHPKSLGEPTDQQIQGINTVLKLTNDQKALAACARQFPEFQISKESLEANERPTLAIVGDQDPFKEYVDKMQGVMSNLEIIIVPGGDHMSTVRSPVFLDGLKAFLDKHRESSAPNEKSPAKKNAA